MGIENRIKRLEDEWGDDGNRPPTLPEHWFLVNLNDGTLAGPGPDEYPSADELDEFELRRSMWEAIPHCGPPLKAQPYL